MIDNQIEILVVDDNPRNIYALKTVLKSRKTECFTALNFNNALEILEKNLQIKIILLDMMMPNIDGYEALKILKENPKFKNIAVLAITAQAMCGDREKCLNAGADDYLAKPVDIEALMSFINKHIAC
jgi:CheY-like chemotaxis protein